MGGTPVLLRQGTPDGGSLNFVMSQLAAQEIPTVLDALAQVGARATVLLAL